MEDSVGILFRHLQGLWGEITDHSHFSTSNLQTNIRGKNFKSFHFERRADVFHLENHTGLIQVGQVRREACVNV